ncbi:GNAT family N-acetyltransferase [Actinomadura vinacea]
MTQSAPTAPVFALLTDGVQVQVRQLTPEDLAAVRTLHAGLSTESLYLRFFWLNRSMVDQVAAGVCREPGPDHLALGAWLKGELVGVAQYECTGVGDEAEIAFAVAERMHHRGVGTLLLEHLASWARARGVRAFRADVLAENSAMLRVFAAAGLPARRGYAAGVIEATLPLEGGDRYLDTDEHYLDAVAARECRAAVASMEPLLRPAVIAVIGAGRRPGSIGAAILHNIRTGGFGGAVYAVNPHAAGTELDGAPCLASPAELPEPPDLAVIAVPAAAVAPTAAACGRRGARAVVVINAGLTAEQGRDLLAACHTHGMRLVGPNCLGIADGASRLNATFAAGSPHIGAAGVAVQSGGVGIALLDHLSRLGIGVSSFASVGDKYDVSGNDMLMWWEADPDTRLGLVHVESFGNPRKFARTARRVAERMPLLTVVAGRSAAGTRAAASHTAAAATPAVTRRALFRQAGIIAADDLGDLVDTAALLALQPLPAGPRVAIVSNRLLDTYGLPSVPWRWAGSEDAAARAAAESGGAVALKAHVPGVVHKTAAGALRLNLRGEDDVRAAYRGSADRFGGDLHGVLVQAMAAEGVEVLCGLVQEEIFGPLVVFGAGGVDTEALADRAARLAPLRRAGPQPRDRPP